MENDPVLFISLKPRFAEMILCGDKTVELRRVAPTIALGALVILYASSPQMQVVGKGRVAALETASPTAVWERHGRECGLSRSEYRAYFAGVGQAVAIVLEDVRRLSEAVPLAKLRERWAGFRPPQSWRYIDAAQAAALI
jgi:predicted transcriptional regulator